MRWWWTHDLDGADIADAQLVILLNLFALDLALGVDRLLTDVQNLTPRGQVLESHPKPTRNTVQNVLAVVGELLDVRHRGIGIHFDRLHAPLPGAKATAETRLQI